MKSKIASILGLIFPFSIALMLTAFLGCGGGGAYGDATQAYDGTWSLNLKGYTVPTPVAPVTAVSCSERFTTIVIAHGSGTVTEIIDCYDATTGIELADYPKGIDIAVTLTPDATGITGTVKLETTGGGASPSSGVCINRVACSATDLMMIKCGETASGC
ncbi:MAG: hypothetical protein WAW02_02215 [Sideroxyarcus sp.]